MIFTSEGKPTVYEEVSVMSFVQGYLAVMDTQTQDIKKYMNSHLQDLMEDGDGYGWPVVRDFHFTWLQHTEMSRATWDDHVTKLKLRRTLVWHQVISAMQGSPPIPHPERQQPYPLPPPPPSSASQHHPENA